MKGKPNLFKYKQFKSEIILLGVRWYLRYALPYRDLTEMMEERGLQVAYTTPMRWIHQYATELDKRTRPHLEQTGDSWKVDETELRQVKYLNNRIECDHRRLKGLIRHDLPGL